MSRDYNYNRSIRLFVAALFTVIGSAGAARAQTGIPDDYLSAGPFGASIQGVSNGIVAGSVTDDSDGNISAVVWTPGNSCGAPVELSEGSNAHLYFSAGNFIYGGVGFTSVVWDGTQPNVPPVTLASLGITDFPEAATADGQMVFGYAWYWDANNPSAGDQWLGGSSNANGAQYFFGGVAGGRIFGISNVPNVPSGYWNLSDRASLNGPPIPLPDPVECQHLGTNQVPDSIGFGSIGNYGVSYGNGNFNVGTSDGNTVMAYCQENTPIPFVYDLTNPAAPNILYTTGPSNYIAVAIDDQYVFGVEISTGDFAQAVAWSISDLSTPISLAYQTGNPLQSSGSAFPVGGFGGIGVGEEALYYSSYSVGTGNVIETPIVWDLTGNNALCSNNPIANAGPPQTVTTGVGQSAQFQLDGTGSTNATSWTWYADGQVIGTGPTPTVTLNYPGDDGAGNSAVYLVVADANGLTAAQQVLMDVNADLCPTQAVFQPADYAPGMVMFEDRWPTNGDLDFNDETITYQFMFGTNNENQTLMMQATLGVVAIGATIHNGLYMHLPGITAAQVSSVTLTPTNTDGSQGAPVNVTPVAGESELVIPILADTRSAGYPSSGFINTVASQPTLTPGASTLSVQVNFNTAVNLSFADAPFDLFIAQTADYTHQIHMPQYSGTDQMDQTLFDSIDDFSNKGINAGRWFVNQNGLPFALNLPEEIEWPLETVSISAAYPDIVGFGTSAGQQHTDWYTSDVNSSDLYPNATEAFNNVGFDFLDFGVCPSFDED